MHTLKLTSIVRIIVLPLLGLFACGDEEFTTTVSGKVVNFGSREPIEGAYVYLKDGVGSSGVVIVDGNTSSNKRSETLTNADGEFTVSLTGEHAAYLGVGKEGYQEFIVANEGAAVGVKSYGFGGNYENQVLELKAEAFFNGAFANSSLSSDQDTLNITLLSYESLTSQMGLVVNNNPYVGKGPFRFYNTGEVNCRQSTGKLRSLKYEKVTYWSSGL